MSNNPLDKPSVIIAAILGSAIGALFYNVLPLYLGMLQEYRGIDNVGIGFVGFIFFSGGMLSLYQHFSGLDALTGK